jgi:hypothetical protein
VLAGIKDAKEEKFKQGIISAVGKTKMIWLLRVLFDFGTI